MVSRIGGVGAAAWGLHYRAMAKVAAGEDVILLSSGDPDFDTPPRVVAALKEAVDAGRTHYSPAAGDPALRVAIAQRESRRAGIEVRPEEVTVMNGGQDGLYTACMCLFADGDEVLVLDPTYATYGTVIRATGAEMVSVPMRVGESGFTLDVDALAAAATDRTRGILLNNPHNPTGAVIPEAELLEVARIAADHDLWMLADEVYSDLVFEGTFVPFRALPGMGCRTVTVGSLSKTHAMTGWRMGWLLAQPELSGHFATLAMGTRFGCATFVQDAAKAALDCTDEELSFFHSTLRRRRDVAVELLAGLNDCKPVVPAAGMFVMLDVRGLGTDTQVLAEALLQEAGVCVMPGEGFGAAASGYLRISLASSEAILRTAVARIQSFLIG